MTDFKSFNENLNTIFTATVDSDQTCEIELIEAESLEKKGQSDNKEAFSLIFKYPKRFQLNQQTYMLEHKVLGDLEIFLVPQMPDDNFKYMEAVFN